MTEPRTSTEVIEALRQIDSATVANAIEHFDVRDPVDGYASWTVLCQVPKLAPTVGSAITCTADTTTAGDTCPMRLHELLDMIKDAPKPAVLVAQYVGSDRQRSCLIGDMFAATLQKLGVVGMITELGGRDFRGIEERAPGFQLFCPGSVVSHGYGVFHDFNLTVSVCGLTVQPGDLLHGDANGVVHVPTEIAGDVVAQSKRVLEEEAAFFDFLHSDAYSYEGLKQRMGRKDPIE